MIVHLYFPPFGTRRLQVDGGATIEQAIELANGALYVLTFTPSRLIAEDEYEARLTAIRCEMPPVTPEVDGYTDESRLPMTEDGVFSARLEAEQRRREWAARGVTY